MLIVEFESLGITTLARIKKIIGAIELHKNGKDDEDVDVTMEFIVGSLFPELLTNFNNKINSEYHRGFRDGYDCGIEATWEDFVTPLKKLNIILQDSEGNFRDTYEVLSEIAEKWKEVERENDENN